MPTPFYPTLVPFFLHPSLSPFPTVLIPTSPLFTLASFLSCPSNLSSSSFSLVRARTPPDFSIPTHDDPLGASSTTFGAQVVVDPYEEEKAMSALRDSIKSGQFSFLFNKCDPPCPIPKGCFYAPPFVYQSSNNQRVGQLMYPVKLPFTAPLTNGKKSKPLYQIKVDDDDGSFIMANDGYLYDPDTKERIGMLQTEVCWFYMLVLTSKGIDSSSVYVFVN